MEKEEMPAWLNETFANAGWWDMSGLCDWADGMFTKNENNVEVYKCLSHAGTISYRLLATVDGDTYIAIKNCMVTSADMVNAYIKRVEPRLADLEACL